MHREEIEALAGRMLDRVLPGSRMLPRPVDLDRLLGEGLGLGWRFADLSGRGALGMTILFCPPQKGGIILIDRQLEGERQRARRRFTLAHEAGHAALHRALLTGEERLGRDRERLVRLERQADAFAAALLMPQEAVGRAVRQACRRNPYLGRAPQTRARVWTEEVAGAFGVSFSAALRRLRTLGYLEPGQDVCSAAEQLDAARWRQPAPRGDDR